MALEVVLCVCLSIVDTLGYMYFWDVTISGVSTRPGALGTGWEPDGVRRKDLQRYSLVDSRQVMTAEQAL